GLLFAPLEVTFWPLIYLQSNIISQIGVLWPEQAAGGAAAGLSATPAPAVAGPVSLGGGVNSAKLGSSTNIGELLCPTSRAATAPEAAEESIVPAIGIEGGSGPSNGPESLLRQIAPARARRHRGGLQSREYGFRPRFTARPPSAG